MSCYNLSIPLYWAANTNSYSRKLFKGTQRLGYALQAIMPLKASCIDYPITAKLLLQVIMYNDYLRSMGFEYTESLLDIRPNYIHIAARADQ